MHQRGHGRTSELTSEHGHKIWAGEMYATVECTIQLTLHASNRSTALLYWVHGTDDCKRNGTRWCFQITTRLLWDLNSDTSADRHSGINDVSNVCSGRTRATAETRREDDVLEDLRDETVLGFGRDLVAVTKEYVSTRLTIEKQ